MKQLFPPDLAEGSSGAAPDALHVILQALGFGDGIERDNEYGPATVKAVKALQTSLGLEGEDVDGNFGPKTRQALARRKGIDVNAILGHEAFECGTEVVTGSGEAEVWNPDSAVEGYEPDDDGDEDDDDDEEDVEEEDEEEDDDEEDDEDDDGEEGEEGDDSVQEGDVAEKTEL